MSGDYNTSLGNTIVNLMAFHSILDDLHIPYDGVFNGDDSVVCIPEQDLARFMTAANSHFTKLGLITKMNVVRDIMDVDFCQGKLVKTSLGWRLVRHPARAISHTAVSIKRYGGKKWLAWLRAVGECELAINKGVPILQEYARALMREAWKYGRVNAAYDRDIWYRKGTERSFSAEITHEARATFWVAFGVPTIVQLDMERRLRDLSFVTPNYCEQLNLIAKSALCPVSEFWMYVKTRL